MDLIKISFSHINHIVSIEKCFTVESSEVCLFISFLEKKNIH